MYVCQGRAVADGGLAVGRFSDAVTARLPSPDELVPEPGFRVRTDEDLLTIVRRVGSPTDHPGPLSNGRVAVPERV